MSTSTKWQRIMFMPGTGTAEDGSRVTGCREHIALSRKTAAEGMVLLKNDGELLPFVRGQKLAVFGKAQADYVQGGGGSGSIRTAYSRSLLDGLRIKEAEGRISLFAPLSEFYEENVNTQRSEGKAPGYTVEPAVPPVLLGEAREFADTALITICRFSSEGRDRTGEPFDGDFYLSREESAMVESVLSAFDRVAVVLNTGAVMDTSWFRKSRSIRAALIMWQAGIEGGLAAADILCGVINPSGRLADTFALDFASYPSSESFAESDDYVEYSEDIYVGYRYFETVPGMDSKVAYPFGYGLSYTSFRLDSMYMLPSEETFPSAAGLPASMTFRGTVTNTGAVPGRQVVQLYCEAPQGRLGKAKKVLVGFSKTALLDPGESGEVEIPVSPYYFSSYDDTGKVAKSAYVLECGEYYFHAGFNVRDTEKLGYVLNIESDTVVEQLSERCAPRQLTKRMLSDGGFEAVTYENNVPRPDDDQSILPFDGQAPDENSWIEEYCTWLDPVGTFLKDVFEGKNTLEEFIGLLTDEQKVSLLCGQPNRGPACTFGVGNIKKFGIPNVMTADGPAGLSFKTDCGIYTTSLPVATLLACTFDTQLVREINAMAASEVYENGVGIWLAPAMNIHRNPLCGRNFEYYSEDPFLAGSVAAAAVEGIQSRGVAASVKHFACNNKETNRRESDSRLSERALREIYLKGFEICVRKSRPWTIMTSYNIINGIRASENSGLLDGILREEWGFEGAVTTDWYTHGEQYREVNAGNDIKMGRGMKEEMLEALNDGRLPREKLEASVRRVLELILKLA